MARELELYGSEISPVLNSALERYGKAFDCEYGKQAREKIAQIYFEHKDFLKAAEFYELINKFTKPIECFQKAIEQTPESWEIRIVKSEYFERKK